MCGSGVAIKVHQHSAIERTIPPNLWRHRPVLLRQVARLQW